MQNCWPTARNIVGPNICCVRLHGTTTISVGTCWFLLRMVWNRSNVLSHTNGNIIGQQHATMFSDLLDLVAYVCIGLYTEFIMVNRSRSEWLAYMQTCPSFYNYDTKRALHRLLCAGYERQTFNQKSQSGLPWISTKPYRPLRNMLLPTLSSRPEFLNSTKRHK